MQTRCSMWPGLKHSDGDWAKGRSTGSVRESRQSRAFASSHCGAITHIYFISGKWNFYVPVEHTHIHINTYLSMYGCIQPLDARKIL